MRGKADDRAIQKPWKSGDSTLTTHCAKVSESPGHCGHGNFERGGNYLRPFRQCFAAVRGIDMEQLKSQRMIREGVRA